MRDSLCIVKLPFLLAELCFYPLPFDNLFFESAIGQDQLLRPFRDPLFKFRIGSPDGLFCLSTFRHIRNGTDHTHRTAGCIPHRLAPVMKPAIGSVFHLHPHFEVVGCTSIKMTTGGLTNHFGIIRMDQRKPQIVCGGEVTWS